MTLSTCLLRSITICPVLGFGCQSIVTYRDSVASIITLTDGENLVLLNNCWIENGKWVNIGQGMADDNNDAQQQLLKQLPMVLYNLPRVAIINAVPQDVTPFVDFSFYR